MPRSVTMPWFGFHMIGNHCPSLFVAFADVLLVKDRVLLAHYTPTLPVLVGMALLWSLGYLGWMEVNHSCNGGRWPCAPASLSPLEHSVCSDASAVARMLVAPRCPRRA